MMTPATSKKGKIAHESSINGTTYKVVEVVVETLISKDYLNHFLKSEVTPELTIPISSFLKKLNLRSSSELQSVFSEIFNNPIRVTNSSVDWTVAYVLQQAEVVDDTIVLRLSQSIYEYFRTNISNTKNLNVSTIISLEK